VFRRSQIYVFPPGGAKVAVAKARSSRAQGAVIYLEAAPRSGRDGTLDVVVDRGVRQGQGQLGASGAYTRLRRVVPLEFERVPGAVALNRRSHAIWASRPIFVPLGDDLRAGTHLVALRPRGLGARPLVRFFSYGGPPVNRINQHIEMSAETGPDPTSGVSAQPSSRTSRGEVKTPGRISR
jgi:hypothetical protein